MKGFLKIVQRYKFERPFVYPLDLYSFVYYYMGIFHSLLRRRVGMYVFVYLFSEVYLCAKESKNHFYKLDTAGRSVCSARYL